MRRLKRVPQGRTRNIAAVTGWNVVRSALVVLAVACSFLAVFADPKWTEVVALTASAVFLLIAIRPVVRDRTAELQQLDLDTFLSGADAVLIEVDLDTNALLGATGPVQELTGYCRREFLQLDHELHIHADDRAGYRNAVSGLGADELVRRIYRFRHRQGHWVTVRDLLQVSENAEGRACLRGIALNITQLAAAQEIIRYQANHDQLTGLANRFRLLDELEDLAPAGPDGYCTLLLDLDRFKEINDTLGHNFGDEVLAEVGSRLSACIRPGDLVARLGGDEFAIVAAGVVTPDQVRAVAERIALAFEAPIRHDGVTVTPKVSIGAVIVTEELPRTEVLRRADLALYEAKVTTGRFHLFDPVLDERSDRQSVRDTQALSAVDRGEFVLHFQPQISLATGDTIGLEGLARWEHPEEGVLGPGDFLAKVLLGDGRSDFTNAMIRQGVEMVSRLDEIGHDRCTVSINICGRSLFDDSFVAVVADALDEFEVTGDRLMFEVPEKELMDHRQEPAPSIPVLAEMGVRLSIDDFGTGYSSLARLRDLPVGEIKIDQTLVIGAAADQRDQTIVRSIIDLAGNLGHSVIAEGVENAEQRSLLLGLGCDAAQGYVFAPPMQADDTLAWLADRRTLELDDKSVQALERAATLSTSGAVSSVG